MAHAHNEMLDASTSKTLHPLQHVASHAIEHVSPKQKMTVKHTPKTITKIARRVYKESGADKRAYSMARERAVHNAHTYVQSHAKPVGSHTGRNVAIGATAATVVGVTAVAGYKKYQSHAQSKPPARKKV